MQLDLYEGCQRLAGRLLMMKDSLSRRFYIDLMGVAEVGYLTLAFEKGRGRNKLRVVVAACSAQQETVLVDRWFSESTWVQVSKLPYTKEAETIRKDPLAAGMNILGLPLPHCASRCFKV